jgi:hypothetical protein
MTVRKNTVVCTFELDSPRISAYEIHEWIHTSLQITEEAVTMIQIHGPKRQVYIKLTREQHVHKLIRETGGQVEYIHVDGPRSQIKSDVAGKGTKAIRIANLPPEVSDDVLKAALIPYGTIVAIRNEIWSKAYRYVVANGIRVITMTVNKNIPSLANSGAQDTLVI